MLVRTDDEVYRVDSVWLGPPRATFPWRARYSSYAVGLLVMIAVMFVQRRVGIELGFFSIAWALLLTVVVTRFAGRRVNDERPLTEWVALFLHELRGPRRREQRRGGPLSASHVRVRSEPSARRARRISSRTQETSSTAQGTGPRGPTSRTPGSGRTPWTRRTPRTRRKEGRRAASQDRR